MSIKTVERGTLYETTMGPLTVRYLSGKDATAKQPVFNMSIGDVILVNGNDRPIDVQYDTEETFFAGHRYEFGPKGEEHFEHPHIHRYETGDDIVEYQMAPGQELLISREDLLALVGRVGEGKLVDGTISTRYTVSVMIEKTNHRLAFGPHQFHVDTDRDWQEEQRNYLKFFAERDGQ